MVPCFLYRVWCHSCLVTELWVAVLEYFPSVVFLTNLLKVQFNHIDVVFVHLVVNTGVPYDQNAKLVERRGNFSALMFPAFRFREVLLDVNDWRFLQ